MCAAYVACSVCALFVSVRIVLCAVCVELCAGCVVSTVVLSVACCMLRENTLKIPRKHYESPRKVLKPF